VGERETGGGPADRLDQAGFVRGRRKRQRYKDTELTIKILSKLPESAENFLSGKRGGRERQRETERETERDRERQRETERDK
jgi:hypothetical protein